MGPEKRKILEDLGGISEELYDRLVGEFTGLARRSMESLKTAAGQADFEKVRSAAHFLRGSAANLRLSPAVSLCEALESAAREKKAETLPALCAELDIVVGRLETGQC